MDKTQHHLPKIKGKSQLYIIPPKEKQVCNMVYLHGCEFLFSNVAKKINKRKNKKRKR